MTDQKTTGPSAKNVELATRIVKEKAIITEWPDGFDVDLIGVVGFRHEERTDSKKVAIENAAQRLAVMLQLDQLELSDTWIEDNLKSQK